MMICPVYTTFAVTFNMTVGWYVVVPFCLTSNQTTVTSHLSIEMQLLLKALGA